LLIEPNVQRPNELAILHAGSNQFMLNLSAISNFTTEMTSRSLNETSIKVRLRIYRQAWTTTVGNRNCRKPQLSETVTAEHAIARHVGPPSQRLPETWPALNNALTGCKRRFFAGLGTQNCNENPPQLQTRQDPKTKRKTNLPIGTGLRSSASLPE
jgi:hypothetical protein